MGALPLVFSHLSFLFCLFLFCSFISSCFTSKWIIQVRALFTIAFFLPVHTFFKIRHSLMAKWFFASHAPRAMESREIVPSVLCLCDHDGRKSAARKDAWNVAQKAASLKE